MTVCIAAACQQNDQERIVLCNDWKEESTISAAETADKLRWLKKRAWPILMAGTSSKADQLVRVYQQHLGQARLTDGNVFDLMKKPAFAQKYNLVDEHTRRRFGISYDYFLKNANKQFPADVVAETFFDIQRIKLGASLIIAGFVDRKAVICQIDSDGETSMAEHFAVIGSGAYVAVPALHKREYDSSFSLMKAIYCVYEAKRLSEIVPSVGDTTSIDIIEPGGKARSLGDKGYDFCEALFTKFGPKPFEPKRKTKKPMDHFKFAKKFFQPFEFE